MVKGSAFLFNCVPGCSCQSAFSHIQSSSSISLRNQVETRCKWIRFRGKHSVWLVLTGHRKAWLGSPCEQKVLIDGDGVKREAIISRTTGPAVVTQQLKANKMQVGAVTVWIYKLISYSGKHFYTLRRLRYTMERKPAQSVWFLVRSGSLNALCVKRLQIYDEIIENNEELHCPIQYRFWSTSADELKG